VGGFEPDEDEQDALLKSMDKEFHFDRPGMLVAPAEARNKWQKKLDGIPGALVYDRKARASARA
jgi:hypothetical protein